MKTDPIRWVCSVCLKVIRRPLVLQKVDGNRHKYSVGKVRLIEPRHCNKPLLLAGEPKRDVHGLRELDSWIDPVDNLIRGPKDDS